MAVSKSTRLLRSLEEQGYVPIEPNITSNEYLLYVVNTQPRDKILGIQSTTLQPNQVSQLYNPAVAFTADTKVSANLSTGSEVAPITEVAELQRVLFVDYPEADPTIFTSVTKLIYSGGVWLQDSTNANIHIIKRGGSSFVKMRIFFPRILSGVQLLLDMPYEVDMYGITPSWSKKTGSVRNEYVLTPADVAKGYLEVEVPLTVTQESFNGVDEGLDQYASAGQCVTSGTVNASLLDMSGNVVSPVYTSYFYQYTGRYFNQILSPTMQDVLSVDYMTGVNGGSGLTINVNSEATNDITLTTSGFYGIARDGNREMPDGVISGKRYLEMTSGGGTSSDFVGLLFKVVDKNNQVRYEKVLGISDGYAIINGVAIEDSNCRLDSLSRLRLAVNYETGDMYVGIDNRWRNGGNWVQRNNLDNVQADGRMPFKPENCGYPALTFGAITHHTFSIRVHRNHPNVDGGNMLALPDGYEVF